MVEVRLERPEDAAAVREIHAAAFGRPDEGRVVDALRAGDGSYLGFVAVEDGVVVGHIVFSPATLHCYGALFTVTALGPVAVWPTRQRQGIGSRLMGEGLAACQRLGRDIVVVLGHPAFYSRFGFVTARPLGLMSEYPAPDEAFMVAELTPQALRGRRGVVLYSPAFRLASDG